MASHVAEAGCLMSEECIIEATVPTGFETVAAEEVEEVFQTKCKSVRGRITFRAPVSKVKDILKLGGVDHCRVQILHFPGFGFSSDPEDCLCRLQLLVKDSQWRHGLQVWSKFQNPDVVSKFQSFKMTHSASPVPNSTEGCYSTQIPLPQSSAVSLQNVDQNADNHVMDPFKTRHQSDHPEGDRLRAEQLSENCRYRLESESNTDRVVRTGSDVDSQHRNSLLQDSGTVCDTLSTETSLTEQGVSHRASKPNTCQTSRETGENLADTTHTVTQQNPPVTNTKQSEQSTKEQHRKDPALPRFRVTCHRTGQHHCFDSMAAAASFGGAVKTEFDWQVDLNHFDVEAVLHIDEEDVSVGIALTPDSLHRRDIVAFGVTTLRPTIAYNMLRMVGIEPGHIVCDPLCGSSSIPIQGALRFPAFQLGGDVNAMAMEKSLCNIRALNNRQAALGRGGLMVDTLQWNAGYLPLRHGVVDAFVSDLPFGKRVGRRSDNLKLYSHVLQQMSRCGKPAARAALLTADVKNMMKALRTQQHWSLFRRCGCNIGGLAAAVFLLHRTSVASQQTCIKSSQSCPPPPQHRVNG